MTTVQGFEWLRCDILELPDPIWALPFFYKIEDAVDNFSFKTPAEKSEFCSWELQRVQEQDRIDGRLPRDYRFNFQQWERVGWSPIYGSTKDEYNPRIAFL